MRNCIKIDYRELKAWHYLCIYKFLSKTTQRNEVAQKTVAMLFHIKDD